MIASLPMYDRPPNAAAHDTLWALIRDGLRDRGIDAPEALDRTVKYNETWGRDDLVLGQICIQPYRDTHRDHVTLIGSSDYGLDGCPAGHFNSLFVCRADDPASKVADLTTKHFASNAFHSYSGYGAPRAYAKANALTLPDPTITGAHDASVKAIANGDLDFACIDAQTWTMQQLDLPEAKQLKVIAATATAPGQSFITKQGQDPAPYFDAIHTAIHALPQTTRTTLGLCDIIRLPDAAYT